MSPFVFFISSISMYLFIVLIIYLSCSLYLFYVANFEGNEISTAVIFELVYFSKWILKTSVRIQFIKKHMQTAKR